MVERRFASVGEWAVDLEVLGLRERKKRDALLRIKQASRRLFIERGYDRTTVRDVAAEANVGLGSIFRYAENKADLLLMLFNEDHAEVTKIAFGSLDARLPFLDQAIAAFRHYYRYFAKNPQLSRSILRESTFYVPAGEAKLMTPARAGIQQALEALVQAARAKGEIVTSESDAVITLLIFEIYQSESRRWLVENPENIEAGLSALRRALDMLAAGIAPKPPRAARH